MGGKAIKPFCRALAAGEFNPLYPLCLCGGRKGEFNWLVRLV